ncbi:bifunctional 3-(3-hydroxy-phenyl)propionate/3-hydroxycinnamic acid hydroxylase [Cupriavidus sp. RAF12]|uniref:bifunctional 3-(3-hydroxy-phenyl)propionate/3-hydroxycinnamic acid hydroxylase n=1 Tax=Cupriavidus sp. RAF12 TaxID=3233050 RepID=UPI003F921E08
MQSTETLHTAVLVVGAGPTGLTLANILGQHGIDTVLIDRKPSTVAEPRAVSIDDESLRTMQAIGLIEPVMKDVVPGYGVHYYTRPDGRCFGKVEPTASDYGFPKRNAFRQPLFEATLCDGLQRFGSVQVLFGHTLEEFTQDDTGVSAVVNGPQGSITVRAAYLVGTDGGRSSVRQAIGSTLVGSSFNARWLVVDTEDDDDPFWQTRAYCDARRPVVEVPGPNRTRRFEFLLRPQETDEATLRPERVSELLRPFRGKRQTNVVRKTVYTFHARVADHWRKGRVFLAGDAAHLTPPYAGQGMNSGVRDAHNLGWKLAAVLRGTMRPSTLDSYEAERRAHAWALIRLALNLGVVMAPSSRLRAWAVASFFTATALVPPVRDYFLKMKFKPKPRLSAGRAGVLEVMQADTARLVGTMLPQPSVAFADDPQVPLDDVIGHRFALLALGVDAAGLTQIAAHPLWRRLGAARVLLLPVPDAALAGTARSFGFEVVCLPGPQWPASFRTMQGRLILVRPDRYIAAICEPSQADALAARFARHMDGTGQDAMEPQAHAAAPAGRAALGH